MEQKRRDHAEMTVHILAVVPTVDSVDGTILLPKWAHVGRDSTRNILSSK